MEGAGRFLLWLVGGANFGFSMASFLAALIALSTPELSSCWMAAKINGIANNQK